MFEVRNREGRILIIDENINVAKQFAERAAKNFNEPFDIFEVKQVWTTQTIDEAMLGEDLDKF